MLNLTELQSFTTVFMLDRLEKDQYSGITQFASNTTRNSAVSSKCRIDTKQNLVAASEIMQNLKSSHL